MRRRILHNNCTTRLPLRRLPNVAAPLSGERRAEVRTALVPGRPQGDGYKKSIREIGAIRGYLFQDELRKFWAIDEMAEPIRMAYMRRHAPADLQRRNGHQ